LPSLQKEIVKCLACSEPLTINQTKKKIHKEYAATHRAFQSLKRKQIIKEVSIKKWQGRKYKTYWLTEKGILAALILGASPKIMLTYASQVYPENNILNFTLKAAQYVNPNIFRIPYASIDEKKALDISDVISVLAIQMTSETNEQNIEALLETIKSFPEYYMLVKQFLESFTEMLLRIKAKL